MRHTESNVSGPDEHDEQGPNQDQTPEQHDPPGQDETGSRSGGQVSEGGAGPLNAETAAGGADSVPDTPDKTPSDRPR